MSEARLGISAGRGSASARPYSITDSDGISAHPGLALSRSQRRLLRDLIERPFAPWLERSLVDPGSGVAVAQGELALGCAGPGADLKVALTVRAGLVAGFSPARPRDLWSGASRTFAWRCSAHGRARWVGESPLLLVVRETGRQLSEGQ
jgi:hypothetical protein